MDPRAHRDHLQFDIDQPQVLDGSRRADASVTDIGRGFVDPFDVGLVERIFERCGQRAVIFRHDEDIAVELADFFCHATARGSSLGIQALDAFSLNSGRSNALRSMSSTSSSSRCRATSKIHCAGFGPKRESRVEPMITAVFSFDTVLIPHLLTAPRLGAEKSTRVARSPCPFDRKAHAPRPASPPERPSHEGAW